MTKPQPATESSRYSSSDRERPTASLQRTSIPMCCPDLTRAELMAVSRVLRTPVLSLGPELVSFEEATASCAGTSWAVGVNSGTSGLHLSVIAAGVQEGDLAITTPFSFVSSANCILYERGIPVFVDVDPATGNLDPSLAAEAVEAFGRNGSSVSRWLPPHLRTSGIVARDRLKMILPVHTFGQPADMDPLLTLARRHGLFVIEDACEAIGAEYKGRKVGSLADAAVFAFYPNKQMTTGEGGMVVTDNSAWNRLFRSLRNQGRDSFDAWLNHTRLGYNYRMDEMSAALGLTQLQRLPELLAKRERVAHWYNERLADVELVECPHLAATTTCMSWFVYVVRVKPPASRSNVMRRLAEAGVPSRPYFTPIHLQLFYRERFGYGPGNFPVAEHLGEVSLALPFSGIMTEDQVDYVCEHLRTILAQ